MSWLTDLISPLAGSFVKDVGDTVKQFVTTEADRLMLGNKLTEIEAKFQTDMEALAIEADKQRVQNASDINSTMRAESASEHWPSYSWRPFIGFIFGIMAFSCYFVLPLMHITPPAVPESVWLSFGAILGVASWHRGKMQADPNIPTSNKG